MGNVITLKGTVPATSNLPKFSDLYPNLIPPNKIIANDTLQRSPTVDITDASIGGTWVESIGGFTVQSDGTYGDLDSANIAYINSGSADVKFQLDVDQSSVLAGIAFRVQDSDNYLRYVVGNTTSVLQKVVAGSATAIGAGVALVGSAPHRIKVVATGDTIKCYDNGTETFSATVTDFNAETNHGIYSDRIANRLSDFILAE